MSWPSHITSVRVGNEILSMAILSPLLIQEGQLSATGIKMTCVRSTGSPL